MNDRAQISRLEDQIYALRERVADLERTLGEEFLPPRALRLTGYERRLLGLLMARDLVRKPAAYTLLYGAGPCETDPKVLDVYIHRIRGKLRPHGVSIETLFALGWSIPANDKARLQAMIDAERRPSAA